MACPAHQTLGLSEAGDSWGVNVFYKRWGLQTLGLSEAGDSWGVNVFYKRWASPRPFVILVRLISIKYPFFKKKIRPPKAVK